MPSRFTTLLRSTALAAVLAMPLAAHAQTPPATPPVAAPVQPADPNRVVAKVGGQNITEADLAVAAEDPALQLPGTDEKQKRDILVGYVVDLKLGAQAAEAAKLADSPEFKRRLAYMRDKLLVDEYLEQETKKAVSADAARKLYDETTKTMKPEEEVRARHILVEDEAEAKKAAARVKGGEDFAKVAAEVSADPGSKTDGGELGFFTKDRMVEPFAEAAFKMKVGEISDPVKSQFGWHIIRLEERRMKPEPTFEELKDQIDQYLTRKAQQDVVLALRKNGKVERLDQPASGTPGAATPK
jgi:peptidyl-prolyl cis-trans isomerase C